MLRNDWIFLLLPAVVGAYFFTFPDHFYAFAGWIVDLYQGTANWVAGLFLQLFKWLAA
jgi:hypothetical protein